MSRPSQQLMYVHPENGITCEYSIWLDWYKGIKWKVIS
jgi:hypothetical protein